MADSILRAEKARTAFVTTPYVSEILKHIDRCRRYSRFDAEPICMMVFGAHGVGKSSIIKKYIKQNDGDSDSDGDIVPVVDIVLKENAKPIDAAREILLKLNDPLALHEKDEMILTKRIVDLVFRLKIELFIIDEFQHLVEKSSNKILHEVGDWLKILIHKTKCPVVLFGMPYSQVVLNSNSQLRSRFSVQFHLRPFSFHNGGAIFTKFLQSLDRALPFENSARLDDEAMVRKLYAFSAGNMRSLRDLIYYASLNAIENGRDPIAISDFIYASQLMSGGKPNTWKNPFEKGVKIPDTMFNDPPRTLGWEDYLRNNKTKKIDLNSLI
ncbi:TniB family NTP-binding protein [Vibrio parahaemolyticus]|nr:TniB family NTP-binding protein [Vibrio parahaemolyticus]